MGAELMAWHGMYDGKLFFCISLPGWWWWGSSAETVPHHDPETPCVERRTTQKKLSGGRRVVTWSVLSLRSQALDGFHAMARTDPSGPLS